MGHLYEEANSIAERLKSENNYIDVRVLDDLSIAALHDLLYTRAIMLSCSRTGYGARFCFDDRELATKRFYELQTEEDVPEGYLASR